MILKNNVENTVKDNVKNIIQKTLKPSNYKDSNSNDSHKIDSLPTSTSTQTIYINDFSISCALGDDESTITRALYSHENIDSCNYPASHISLNQEQEILEIPYFKCFEPMRLSDFEICNYIETHIISTIKKAGWPDSDINNIPIFIGSTSYSMPAKEKELEDAINNKLMNQTDSELYCLNTIALFFEKKYKNNQVFTIATSCTSGANGILYAKQFLEMGYAKRAIIVGFESYNALTLNGFHALGLLCPQHSFPFSSHSEGLILGEGIAVIAMSTAPNNSPNNHIKSKEITLAGGANICDTHNITGTHPDGNKVVQIIQKALDNANIDATQINAIKAHATGCQSGDTAEVLGISKLFPSNIPIAIFKPYIGHTLGACGVLELILLIISLKQGALPAMPKIHQNHFEQFEKFDTQTILPFHLVSQGIPLTEGYYLLNYLGFGGSNTALILGFH